jgi:tetratricopeptide (TPR) repeat protein
LYTEELLKHLRTPGLTIEQVFKRTRAGVLERSGGSQIPAEYSRLIGEDICLAGPAPQPQSPSAPEAPNDPLAAALSRAVKAEPVPLPGVREINRMAADGKALQCLAAIRDRAEVEGAGEFAAVPLSLLLEQVKEDLKDLTAPGAKTAGDEAICAGVLEVLPRALPETHSLYKSIAAKAHNRRGDSYFLLGMTERALAEYEAALPLAPDDAYILYNRGRAKLALGHRDAAKADFIEAAGERFNQPKARKLAQEALAALN